MLLRRDGEGLRDLHHLQTGRRQFGAARRTVVQLDDPAHDDAGLLSQRLRRLEIGLRHAVTRDHALANAAAITQQHEEQLALAAHVVEPTAQGNFLPVVSAQVLHAYHLCRHNF